MVTGAITINGRELGAGNPVYVIAATGSGHNGRLDDAKALVDEAAKGGADAVMFQTYGPDLVHDDAPNPRTLVDTKRVEDRPGAFAQYTRGKSRLFNPAWHDELSRHAESRGVDYIPSVFTDAGLEDLARRARAGTVRLRGIGIESLDHSDPHFVAKVAAVARELGVPLVMSTGVRQGRSHLRAVEAARQAGCSEILLLHSVFGSPSAPGEQGLIEIGQASRHFGLPVGFSDHTVGHPGAGEAVARDAVLEGASAYKVQIRLSNRAGEAPAGPHRALTGEQLRARVATVKAAKKVHDEQPYRVGSLDRRAYDRDPGVPRPSEQEFAALGRVVVPLRDIRAGEPLGHHNVTTRRGGNGMPAAHLVPGMVAATDLKAGKAVPPQAVTYARQVPDGWWAGHGQARWPGAHPGRSTPTHGWPSAGQPNGHTNAPWPGPRPF